MSKQYKDDHIQPHIKDTYQILQKIGSGAYGHVWKVKDKKNNQLLALKKVFLAFQNDVDAQRTFRQIAILRKLEHPNIVKLKNIIKAENDLDIYLAFQYVECDLFTGIKDGVLNEVHKKYIIFQIAKTLKYLHSAGILHRDLKPSNILLDSSCKIKICDFGLSRTLSIYESKIPVMTEFIATRWYRAPEVLFGSTSYSIKSDMWSLGCLIYELYAERPLMPGDDSINQIQKLLEFKGFPTKQQMKNLNVNRIQVLLSHFKTKKQPLNFFYRNSWDPSLLDLLEGLFKYSPQERWDSDKLLSSEFLSQFQSFQDIPTSSHQVKISFNDNVRKDKQFYKTLIYKLFVKEVKLKKGVLKSFHSQSLTNSRRNVSISKRKPVKNSISLHTKLPSTQKKEKDQISTSFRKKKQLIKPLGQKISVKSEMISPYSKKVKEQSKYNLYYKQKKENGQELKKKNSVKIETKKSINLKRKGFIR